MGVRIGGTARRISPGGTTPDGGLAEVRPAIRRAGAIDALAAIRRAGLIG
jgi:hypothetical protein